MKKLFAIVIALVLLCSAALAEAAWSGPVLVGTLPKDAEVIKSESYPEGYIESLLYDGVYNIILAHFADFDEMQLYVDSFYPANEVMTLLDDHPMIEGYETLHMRGTTGANEDTRALEYYPICNEDHAFMFLVNYPVDFELDAELLEAWVSSLNIFEP